MSIINTKYPVVGDWGTRQGGRPENQDSCGFIDTRHGLLVMVCDGMGGGPAGQLASSIAVKRIAEHIAAAPAGSDRCQLVKQAVIYAHQAIVEHTKANPATRGMGTTATVLLLNEHSAVIGHVGDSRVYQFRRGKVIFRTADHSRVGELVRNGTLTEEQARLSSQSNVITRALGGGAKELADVTERPYEAGDRFMLCSDGIWGAMPEPELIKAMTKSPSVPGTVEGVVVSADEIGRNNGGHHDNLTIALIQTKTDSLLKEKMSKQSRIIITILSILCAVSLLANLFLYFAMRRPSKAAAEVTRLTEETQRLTHKLDSVERINKDLLKESNSAKGEAIKAKNDLLDEKKKAEEAEKAEAERKRKAEEEAAQQAKSHQQASAATPVQQLRSKVIGQLQAAAKAKEGTARNSQREACVTTLRELAKRDPQHKNDYQWVADRLNDALAIHNRPNTASHYERLIERIKNLK